MRSLARAVAVFLSAVLLLPFMGCDEAPVGVPSKEVQIIPKYIEASVGDSVIYGASATGFQSPVIEFRSSDTTVARIGELHEDLQVAASVWVVAVGEGAAKVFAEVKGSAISDSADLVVPGQ